MPFGSFQQIGDIAKAYRIVCTPGSFVIPLASPPLSDSLRAELEFALQRGYPARSEFARCENFIHPILREVWKHYLDDLVLWSHEPLHFDTALCGTPDYFLARLSPLGSSVMEEPYLLVVEAKREDFERGWAQCLAAMLAAQKLNPNPDLVVHGIVTTGFIWQFGKLERQSFIMDGHYYSISHLEELLGAVHYLFEQGRQQLRAHLSIG